MYYNPLTKFDFFNEECIMSLCEYDVIRISGKSIH